MNQIRVAEDGCVDDQSMRQGLSEAPLQNYATVIQVGRANFRSLRKTGVDEGRVRRNDGHVRIFEDVLGRTEFNVLEEFGLRGGKTNDLLKPRHADVVVPHVALVVRENLLHAADAELEIFVGFEAHPGLGH